YDYLQLLSNATGGRISIFDHPMIKSMGEYISRSYVGDGWVVNFADASAKGGGEPGLIYRYGKATGSREMQQFAAYLIGQRSGYELNADRDFFRTIENIASYESVLKEQPALTTAPYTWYPQTQVCYIKNKQGFFFAAKGGHNNESHNHNDVGSFSLYVDRIPVFIDAGVGTYTRQTFSSERYSIWTMQSNFHNLPLINGVPQSFGASYKAKDVQFDAAKASFRLDISGAYPAAASVHKWIRTYTLSNENGLTLTDEFQLSAIKEPDQWYFLTWAKPDISHDGKVLLEKNGQRIEMTYDAAAFAASVDAIPQTDTRLSNVWGKEIYRLQLTARQKTLSGKYTFAINRF
ncbi:MAG TPA: heparinase II/III family protein, partial [Sediminibacterium sp.]